MLTINKKQAQRQMPKKKEITSNKSYTDIIYGYLQANCSIVEENKRKIILKNQLKFTDMANTLKISRQTASKKFKQLIDLGLIEEKSNEYELITFPTQDAFLIELETLRILTNALNQNSINIYVYLLNRYVANQEQSYIFTLNQLKDYIGFSTNTRTNNSTITDILQVLQKLGLLAYSVENIRDSEGKYLTQYSLKWITNSLHC